jgi:hypothetical protein
MELPSVFEMPKTSTCYFTVSCWRLSTARMDVYLSASIDDTFIFFLLSINTSPKRLELKKKNELKQLKVSVATVPLD